jgi:hypothetical protein
VIVIVSPVDAWATTAEAFCFRARIPTSLMFFNVAHCEARAFGIWDEPRRHDRAEIGREQA